MKRETKRGECGAAHPADTEGVQKFPPALGPRAALPGGQHVVAAPHEGLSVDAVVIQDWDPQLLQRWEHLRDRTLAINQEESIYLSVQRTFERLYLYQFL